ncbi:hypothetical protein UVI_02045710 [Ustilaginoidea virens]|uniref:Uncharacterized protein n=1 Tax=Ustilaginoidea virens TaxID=1159556 RepID=A0A1B5L7J4_USTVR|nr:hypothetical protein UVI_02045710 [Ustilaginoidea virens]
MRLLGVALVLSAAGILPAHADMDVELIHSLMGNKPFAFMAFDSMDPAFPDRPNYYWIGKKKSKKKKRKRKKDKNPLSVARGSVHATALLISSPPIDLPEERRHVHRLQDDSGEPQEGGVPVASRGKVP